MTVYASVETGKFYSTNSDAIVYPYLFKDGLNRHVIAVPSHHANIIKFPLFYLEANLPYHYTTFILANLSLVLLTVTAWAYLLIKLFGKKYAVLILILLSALIATSAELDINLSETTIRNIEFPIALGFIFVVSRLLKGMKYNRRDYVLLIVGCTLYSLTLAGDSYFEYATSLPILIVIGWYWLQSRKFSKQMLKAVILVLGVSIGASLIRLFLIKSDIIVAYNSPAQPIVTYANLWGSISTALNQLLGLQGASIFGLTVSLPNFAFFVNIIFFIAGFVALILILKRTDKDYREKRNLTTGHSFVLTTAAMSFFTIFWVYILSGEVAQTLANGQVVSLGQERYIAFLPLLSFVGIIWLIKTYYSSHRGLIAILIIVSIVQIITAIHGESISYNNLAANNPPSRIVLSGIVNDLHKDKVNEVVSGYWYGATVRFWSHGTVHFAAIVSCNVPFNFNVREDWYHPQGFSRTALLVDRSGPDAASWGCSDSALEILYGNPVKKQEIQNQASDENVFIWVYNYDVRQRLQSFPSED